MRALVFLLVLANLLFYTYARGYFGPQASSDAGRMAQQVSVERLRIVARGEPPPTVAPVAAAPAPRETCLAWGGLIAAEADRLAATLAERAPAAHLERKTEVTTAKTWWVYVAPQPTKADAERRAGELKKLGVSEYFLVQDPGPNRYALSLGVFSVESKARAYLESLRAKGIKSLRIGPKSGAEQLLAIEARGPENELAPLREGLGDRTAVECASPANGANMQAARP